MHIPGTEVMSCTEQMFHPTTREKVCRNWLILNVVESFTIMHLPIFSEMI